MFFECEIRYFVTCVSLLAKVEVITYTDVDKIVKSIDFDILVTGPDQCHEGFQNAIKWCEEHNKEHVVLGRTEGISSSELKAKISEKTKSINK